MSHLEFTPNLANSNQNSQHNCSSQIIINETFLSYFQTLCKCASKFKFTPLSCLESLTNANCTFVKKKKLFARTPQHFRWSSHTMFFCIKSVFLQGNFIECWLGCFLVPTFWLHQQGGICTGCSNKFCSTFDNIFRPFVDFFSTILDHN